MPQLPKKNTLDYAPDSIISASKRLSVVQSSQMKDATEMDASVRPIKNENDTKTEMKRFVDKIGEIGDLFNFIRTQSASYGYRTLSDFARDNADREEGAGRGHLQRLYGGMDPSEEGLSAMSGLFDEPKSPRGRPRKVKVVEDFETMKPVKTIIDYFETMSGAPSSRPAGKETARAVSSADFEDRAEARGQARSSARDEDFDELEDAEGGDGDPSEPSSSSSSGSIYSDISRATSRYEDEGSRGAVIVKGDPRSTIINAILRATKLMREADTIALALKDYKQYLAPNDIEELKLSYQVLIKKWETFKDPIGGMDLFAVLDHEIDFAGQMIKVLNDERKKLMMDILILVNTYTATVLPSFDPNRLLQPVANVLDTYGAVNQISEALGAGRNFYGKTINTSKDIPNIYGMRQACPTKYLL